VSVVFPTPAVGIAAVALGMALVAWLLVRFAGGRP